MELRPNGTIQPLSSFRLGAVTMTSEDNKPDSANGASSVRWRRQLPLLIHFLHHRPPTWLALAIGAGTGALTGMGIGMAFGGWWLPSITLMGIVLGSIASFDLLLPRPDWVPALEGPETKRYAGPFESVAALLLCGFVAVAAGLFFANASVSVRFVRQSNGQLECWNISQFLFGHVQRSSHTVGVHDVALDAHGGIFFGRRIIERSFWDLSRGIVFRPFSRFLIRKIRRWIYQDRLGSHSFRPVSFSSPASFSGLRHEPCELRYCD